MESSQSADGFVRGSRSAGRENLGQLVTAEVGLWWTGRAGWITQVDKSPGQVGLKPVVSLLCPARSRECKLPE